MGKAKFKKAHPTISSIDVFDVMHIREGRAAAKPFRHAGCQCIHPNYFHAQIRVHRFLPFSPTHWGLLRVHWKMGHVHWKTVG